MVRWLILYEWGMNNPYPQLNPINIFYHPQMKCFGLSPDPGIVEAIGYKRNVYTLLNLKNSLYKE